MPHLQMENMASEVKYYLRINEYHQAAIENLKIIEFAMSNGRHQNLNSIHGKEAKVYNPSLYLFLSAGLYPAQDFDTLEQCEISTYSYFISYCEGFDEGEKYFNINFNPSLSILYDISNGFIENIRLNHFEVLHDTFVRGWVDIKNHCPLIVSKSEIKRYGYYSGIVSQVEVLAAKHPKLFPGFIYHNRPLSVHKTDSNKTKSDFSKINLQPIIQNFQHLQGYESPLNILNDLLKEVEQFNDKDFRYTLFLNVHHLCKENKDLIWSDTHRAIISDWFKKAGIVSFNIECEQVKNLFETTWDNTSILPDRVETHLTDDISPKERKLREDFEENGFFNLPIPSKLTSKQQDQLINLISTSNDQFKMAMVEYLGIIKSLRDKLLVGKQVINLLSIILSIKERRVKGNINSFNQNSRDRGVYKAFLELSNVKKEFERITTQK